MEYQLDDISSIKDIDLSIKVQWHTLNILGNCSHKSAQINSFMWGMYVPVWTKGRFLTQTYNSLYCRIRIICCENELH